LDLLLHIVNRVRGLHIQSDGLASQCLHEDLHCMMFFSFLCFAVLLVNNDLLISFLPETPSNFLGIRRTHQLFSGMSSCGTSWFAGARHGKTKARNHLMNVM
jgi:hypothetical protein